MLVLSRTRDEEIDIIDTQTGEVILVIRVVEVRGVKVRLGFSASSRFEIIRDELRTTDVPESISAVPQPIDEPELSPVS